MFLEEVLRHCPFPIQLIQTDNGVKFTNKFISNPIYAEPKEHALDRWCREQGIRHKLNPVGEKELNGCVERNHRIDDVEFYSFHQAKSQQELNRLLAGWVQEHNSIRRYKPLRWRT
jgi:transposase InsO family protein